MGKVYPYRFFSSYLLIFRFSSVPKRDTYSPLIFGKSTAKPFMINGLEDFTSYLPTIRKDTFSLTPVA
jgi:hypothetical protein